MAEEDIIQLLDLSWFRHEIFSNRASSCSVVHETDPVAEVEELKISHMSSGLHVRSLSDQLWSFSSDSESISPNSTLPTLKLQTIQSGKEFVTQMSVKQEEETKPAAAAAVEITAERKQRRRIRRRGKQSKSLSDLEFEEVKGFMDLGFVFSEQDKYSSLVSIIPGLQRLHKDTDDPEAMNKHKQMVSRPYLSEAWEALDEVKNPLMNWRFPAPANDVTIKHHLRFWAHTVASTVK